MSERNGLRYGLLGLGLILLVINRGAADSVAPQPDQPPKVLRDLREAARTDHRLQCERRLSGEGG